MEVKLSLADTVDRDHGRGCAALVGRNGGSACNGSHGGSKSHKECAFQEGCVAKLVELCCGDADQQSVASCKLLLGRVALADTAGRAASQADALPLSQRPIK